MSLAPGTNLGPYEILASLGAGGMGEVYHARDHRLGRAVAIKVLSASQDTDPERKERFAREARAIARLSHPNICTLYDVGEQNGTVFLVMELVEGETVADRLELGPIPIDRALSIAVQVAEALHAAHKKGVIHRDLKPSNLMLTPTGVKLLDFGVAKLKEDAESAGGETKTSWVTDRETAIGTLPYMAPEQIEGREIDARTDIFAFGVMVFEMIAGRRPFGGSTRASLMAAIVGSEPLSLAELQPGTPPILERLIGRCLVKDVELRWQTARDLATELRWFAETRPDKAAVAIPPAHWSRRAVIIGGLAALTVLVAALAALSGFIGRKQTPARCTRRLHTGVVPSRPRDSHPTASRSSTARVGRASRTACFTAGRESGCSRPPSRPWTDSVHLTHERHGGALWSTVDRAHVWRAHAGQYSVGRWHSPRSSHRHHGCRLDSWRQRTRRHP
jgi:serine/threonine protein kinase